MALLTTHASRPLGITLIESLVTLCLLAVLATLAIPSFQGFTDKRKLEGVANEYASHLQWARSHALQTGSTVRIKVESGDAKACYIIHQASPGACSCLSDHGDSFCDGDNAPLLTVHFPADARVRIRNHGTAERRIDPMRGILTPTGTVEFSTVRGHSVRAITNLMGRTRLCAVSPHRIGGLPPC